MPSKRKNSRNSSMPEIEFLRVRLSDADKEKIKAQDPDPARLMTDLIRIVESGHKVSFTYVESNDNVTCAITSPQDPESGKRTVVSSFGPDVESALMASAYKFFVITDGGQWSLAETWNEGNDIG